MRIHGLRPKEAKFVQEYLKDLNATKACVRAGYALKFADRMAYKLVEKSRVSREIRRRMEKRAARLQITQDKVVAEYAKVAFANMLDYVEWGPAGVGLLPSEDMSPEDGAAVAEVSEKVDAMGGIHVGIKLHNKVAALDALSRHLGMFRELPIESFDAFLAQLPGEVGEYLRQLAVRAIQRRNPTMVSGEPVAQTRETDRGPGGLSR